jgi:hypothetical protein
MVADHLGLFRYQKLQDSGGSVDWGVVLVQKPVLGRHDGPLLPKTTRNIMYRALTALPLGILFM